MPRRAGLTGEIKARRKGAAGSFIGLRRSVELVLRADANGVEGRLGLERAAGALEESSSAYCEYRYSKLTAILSVTAVSRPPPTRKPLAPQSKTQTAAGRVDIEMLPTIAANCVGKRHFVHLHATRPNIDRN